MRYNHFSMLPDCAFQAGAFGRPRTLEGGGGGSSSTTEQTTQNIDRRQVVGEYGLGISSDTSTISVAVTDQKALQVASDAVSSAIGAVREGDLLQQQGFETLVNAARYTLAEVFKAIDKNQQLVNTVSNGVADAYDTAQSAVSGNRDAQRFMLIAGAILVGVMLINKKGA